MKTERANDIAYLSHLPSLSLSHIHTHMCTCAHTGIHTIGIHNKSGRYESKCVNAGELINGEIQSRYRCYRIDVRAYDCVITRREVEKERKFCVRSRTCTRRVNVRE